MRHLSSITKAELLEIAKIVLYSDSDVHPEQWEILPFAGEPAIGIRLDAEDYEIRIVWENNEPLRIFTTAIGHFESIEPSKLNRIQTKLQEMGFDIPTLETWGFPDTDLILEEKLDGLGIQE
ncbi:hypothetical protein AHMF7605_22480 [Adhaeribacter arboris]|uniref:Uncharacterized protein n=1 Tax=Adhaeribacter arboris TaxID=2072846 RepID=A0A2T2YKN6_9BACT|nr:hypothetical protein [Adhaeribacter arboris]PSR56068.1 hypothetical protein AHMF7605_22480 [Adhaeribacter arboris]